jgi:hypothetical protein
VSLCVFVRFTGGLTQQLERFSGRWSIAGITNFGKLLAYGLRRLRRFALLDALLVACAGHVVQCIVLFARSLPRRCKHAHAMLCVRH